MITLITLGQELVEKDPPKITIEEKLQQDFQEYFERNTYVRYTATNRNKNIQKIIIII